MEVKSGGGWKVGGWKVGEGGRISSEEHKLSYESKKQVDVDCIHTSSL
jgi:hypothetical protein